MRTLTTDHASGAADAETADVALAASGDSRAFERLYRTHVPRVYSLARRMLDPGEADDVAQDVFVRAWQKLATLGRRASGVGEPKAGVGRGACRGA